VFTCKLLQIPLLSEKMTSKTFSTMNFWDKLQNLQSKECLRWNSPKLLFHL